MPGPEFFQTGYGRRFYDVHVPALVSALERIATQLERSRPHTVADHCPNHGLFECGNCEAVACMGCRLRVVVNVSDDPEIKTILGVCSTCFPDERVFKRGGAEYDAVVERMRKRTEEPIAARLAGGAACPICERDPAMVTHTHAMPATRELLLARALRLAHVINDPSPTAPLDRVAVFDLCHTVIALTQTGVGQ